MRRSDKFGRHAIIFRSPAFALVMIDIIGIRSDAITIAPSTVQRYYHSLIPCLSLRCLDELIMTLYSCVGTILNARMSMKSVKKVW